MYVGKANACKYVDGRRAAREKAVGALASRISIQLQRDGAGFRTVQMPMPDRVLMMDRRGRITPFLPVTFLRPTGWLAKKLVSRRKLHGTTSSRD